MPTRKKVKRMFQVKEEFRGKVKLQTGEATTLLDENTAQAVLAQLHDGSTLGQMYIELVPTAPAVVAQTK